eukprot:9504043-Pyramimonas_sp.AAC.1
MEGGKTLKKGVDCVHYLLETCKSIPELSAPVDARPWGAAPAAPALPGAALGGRGGGAGKCNREKERPRKGGVKGGTNRGRSQERGQEADRQRSRVGVQVRLSRGADCVMPSAGGRVHSFKIGAPGSVARRRTRESSRATSGGPRWERKGKEGAPAQRRRRPEVRRRAECPK